MRIDRTVVPLISLVDSLICGMDAEKNKYEVQLQSLSSVNTWNLFSDVVYAEFIDIFSRLHNGRLECNKKPLNCT